jgi:hypothetical protein
VQRTLDGPGDLCHARRRVARVTAVRVIVRLPGWAIRLAPPGAERGAPDRSQFLRRDGHGALLHGRARGDAATGCVWIVAGRERYAVVWPRGFAARRRPLRIYRRNGALAAVEGERVRSGGGFVPAASVGWTLGAKPLTPCIEDGAVWVMSDTAAPARRP